MGQDEGSWLGWTYMVFVVGSIQVNTVPARGEEDFGSEAETWFGWQAGVLHGGCFLEAHVSNSSLSVVALVVSAMRRP